VRLLLQVQLQYEPIQLLLLLLFRLLPDRGNEEMEAIARDISTIQPICTESMITSSVFLIRLEIVAFEIHSVNAYYLRIQSVFRMR
jgi:hypothetical protein